METIPSPLLSSARDHLKDNHFAEAVILYHKALARGEGNVDDITHLAVAMNELIKNEEKDSKRTLQNLGLLDSEGKPTVTASHYAAQWCKSRGRNALNEKRQEEAYIYLEKALTFDAFDKDALSALCREYFEAGRMEDAARLAEAYQTLNPYDSGVQGFLNQVKARQLPTLPGVFINTLPKSGSCYILDTLCEGLNLPRKPISAQCFPLDVATPALISEFVRGNALDHQHLSPTFRNLFNLSYYGIKKFVVHVRDPRQTLLSLVHHFDDAYERKTLSVGLDFPFSDAYFSLSLSDKIDWCIENCLPVVVGWIEGWVATAEENAFELNIKITRYEDMKEDPEGFFFELLDFFEIPRSRFQPPKKQEKAKTRNFRKGLTDEWRTVFNPKQIEKVSRMVPLSLLENLGWESRLQK